MKRLKRLYGNFMVGISYWFMERGERYAEWHDLHECECGKDHFNSEVSNEW